MNINEIQDEIIDEFNGFDDWMDKYQLLIDMGNTLEPLDEQYKQPQYLIEGCQSRVWFHAECVEGKVVLEAESDAVIVKGIVSLLLRVLSGRTPKEILESELYFIDEIGLKDHLSPTRANGLVSMVRQIRNYATVFHLKEQ
jgi:cysteine desulfuration protein SufE